MKARDFSTSKYRYKFNGKEADEETETTDYGMRIQDGDLGIFLSIDPLEKNYPFYTPYQYASNTPISAIDIDGLESDQFFNEVDCPRWKSGGISLPKVRIWYKDKTVTKIKRVKEKNLSDVHNRWNKGYNKIIKVKRSTEIHFDAYYNPDQLIIEDRETGEKIKDTGPMSGEDVTTLPKGKYKLTVKPSKQGDTVYDLTAKDDHQVKVTRTTRLLFGFIPIKFERDKKRIPVTDTPEGDRDEYKTKKRYKTIIKGK